MSYPFSTKLDEVNLLGFLLFSLQEGYNFIQGIVVYINLQFGAFLLIVPYYGICFLDGLGIL